MTVPAGPVFALFEDRKYFFQAGLIPEKG